MVRFCYKELEFPKSFIFQVRKKLEQLQRSYNTMRSTSITDQLFYPKWVLSLKISVNIRVRSFSWSKKYDHLDL
jgi:hypothetical protein